MDGAGAAVGRVASDVGPRETEVVAKCVHEQRAWLHLKVMLYAVDVKGHPNWRAHSLSSFRGTSGPPGHPRPYSSAEGM